MPLHLLRVRTTDAEPARRETAIAAEKNRRAWPDAGKPPILTLTPGTVRGGLTQEPPPSRNAPSRFAGPAPRLLATLSAGRGFSIQAIESPTCVFGDQFIGGSGEAFEQFQDALARRGIEAGAGIS